MLRTASHGLGLGYIVWLPALKRLLLPEVLSFCGLAHRC